MIGLHQERAACLRMTDHCTDPSTRNGWHQLLQSYSRKCQPLLHDKLCILMVSDFF